MSSVPVFRVRHVRPGSSRSGSFDLNSFWAISRLPRTHRRQRAERCPPRAADPALRDRELCATGKGRKSRCPSGYAARSVPSPVPVAQAPHRATGSSRAVRAPSSRQRASAAGVRGAFSGASGCRHTIRSRGTVDARPNFPKHETVADPSDAPVEDTGVEWKSDGIRKAVAARVELDQTTDRAVPLAS